jgi:hypothetical protein
MAFQKAERSGMFAKVALIGPSGSGKSFSALAIATGIAKACGSRIAFINTERNRGELYSDRFDYDIENLEPDFTPEKFIDAINEAISLGYKVAIIDSASHEWMGQGGIMDMLDHMPGENSYTKWAKLTPRHNRFVDAIRDSPIHLIVCLRGKDEYALEENDKGKKVPRKIGMGAQMRDGLEYEVHISFNLAMNHVASVESGKDNSTMFNEKYDVLTPKHGEQIYAWANSGKAPTLKPLTLKEQMQALDKDLGEIMSSSIGAVATFSDEDKSAARKVRLGITKIDEDGHVKLVELVQTYRAKHDALRMAWEAAGSPTPRPETLLPKDDPPPQEEDEPELPMGEEESA